MKPFAFIIADFYLLRKSGTEPVLRVMSEAGTLEECEKHVDYIINAMKESGHLIEVKK